jgi:hypothetical protein
MPSKAVKDFFNKAELRQPPDSFIKYLNDLELFQIKQLEKIIHKVVLLNTKNERKKIR